MKPTGVTLHRADGTVLNCELVHRGVDDDGMDCWEIANAVYRAGDRVHIAVFPAKTSIGFTGSFEQRRKDMS